MLVKCIDKGFEDHLTVGKTYEVLETVPGVPDKTKQDYILVGDNGERDRFITELFETPTPAPDPSLHHLIYDGAAVEKDGRIIGSVRP